MNDKPVLNESLVQEFFDTIQKVQTFDWSNPDQLIALNDIQRQTN